MHSIRINTPAFYLMLFIWLIAGSPACKKTPPPAPGATLQIETSPATGSVQAAAPGPDFPLVVTVKSAMPPAGVKIDVSARPEGSSVAFFTQSANSTNAVNNFTITGTPLAITCVVEVTVTDQANTVNKGTASYRYSRK